MHGCPCNLTHSFRLRMSSKRATLPADMVIVNLANVATLGSLLLLCPQLDSHIESSLPRVLPSLYKPVCCVKLLPL